MMRAMRIYLSHSVGDADRLLPRRVATMGRAYDFTVQVAANLAAPGESASRARWHIRRCDAVLVIATSGGSAAAQVEFDVSAANAAGKPVLVIADDPATVAPVGAAAVTLQPNAIGAMCAELADAAARLHRAFPRQGAAVDWVAVLGLAAVALVAMRELAGAECPARPTGHALFISHSTGVADGPLPARLRGWCLLYGFAAHMGSRVATPARSVADSRLLLSDAAVVLVLQARAGRYPVHLRHEIAAARSLQRPILGVVERGVVSHTCKGETVRVSRDRVTATLAGISAGIEHLQSLPAPTPGTAQLAGAVAALATALMLAAGRIAETAATTHRAAPGS